jgi:hypothetical protein
MTQATSKRRGQNEDSVYWDDAKNRYVGAVSLGYSPSGTRIRKKVMGRTKTEVRDKLKELHAQVESGVRPRRHYTVNDALDDPQHRRDRLKTTCTNADITGTARAGGTHGNRTSVTSGRLQPPRCHIGSPATAPVPHRAGRGA